MEASLLFDDPMMRPLNKPLYFQQQYVQVQYFIYFVRRPTAAPIVSLST